MDLKGSRKKLSVIALTLLIVVSGAMIYYAKNIVILEGMEMHFVSGPKFYPIVLSVLMIIFCAFSILNTLKGPEKTLEFRNIQKPIIVLVITFLWIFMWNYVGYFYLCSFVAMGLLMFYLNPEKFSFRKIYKSLVFDAIIVTSIYIIFSVALKMQI